MKWIITALVLGIFLNMSTYGGHSFPIGSVVATVIMGIYIKTSQDKHFEEIKRKLDSLQENADESSSEELPGK